MTAALLLAAALAAAPAPHEVELLTQRQDAVWGFDFLPDGRILFTERGGRLGLFDPKTGGVEAVAGAPAVWANGQGGLLDARVAPGFAKNRFVYLTWSEPVADGAATALGRGRLVDGRLEGFKTLLLTDAGGGNGEHFGSRVEFLDGHLFLSVGERGRRELSQDPARHNGKILRLTMDGKPAGAGLPGAAPEVWSLGHRNPQGLARRPGTGQLWSAEFGPRGGDELNLVKPGRNYGWPLVTHGREYWGPRIGVSAKEGYEPPVAHWVPSISPSALAFLDRDTAVLACLSGRHLRVLRLKGDRVESQESRLAGRGWRLRAARRGPDGRLYFSTDDGKLARLGAYLGANSSSMTRP
ncbi:MAG: PQQ-dependent sugar dehydrogenase [Elusimicrobiota bacterium]|nr:PQQ-dependent sugar dehydrogenase [Elusimicrobiota bacterium]